MDNQEALKRFRKFKTFREYQEDAINKAFDSDKKVVVLKAPTGSGKCVKKGTLILTTEGLKPVEFCMDNSHTVLSLEEETCTVQAHETVGSYRKDGEKIVTTTTQSGYSIGGTPDHKIVCIDQTGAIKWVALEDLAIGDVVPLYVNDPSTIRNEGAEITLLDYVNGCDSTQDGTFPYKTIKLDMQSVDTAYFLGRLVADGNVTLHNSISLTTTQQTDKIFMEKYFKEVGLPISISQKKNNKAFSIVCSSVDLSYKLQQLGISGKSVQKTLPYWLFQSNYLFITSFLAGMFDGDSHFSKNVVEYYTSSKTLAYQVQQLLLFIGVVSTVKYKKASYAGKAFDSYRVVLVNDFIAAANLPLKNKKKQIACEKLISKTHNTNVNCALNIRQVIRTEWESCPNRAKIRRFVEPYMYGYRNPSIEAVKKFCTLTGTNHPILLMAASGKWFFDTIAKTEVSESDTVYDMHVDTVHNYFANGFIAHNSLIGAVLAARTGEGLYLVQTKALQDQIIQDFPSPEFEILMGRDNYPCLLDATMTRADCPYPDDTQCPVSAQCPYKVQKRRVLKSDIAVLNYAYFMIEANYIGGFSDRKILIADEADLLEGSLTNFIELTLTEKVFTKYGLADLIHLMVDVDMEVVAWTTVVEALCDKVILAREEVKARVDQAVLFEDVHDIQKVQFAASQKKELDRIENLLAKCNMFLHNVDDSWLCEQTVDNDNGYKWSFSPLWLTKELTEYYFLRHTDKVVLMSASFPDLSIVAQNLGIEVADMEYVEVPSTFPPENRPIHILPKANMSMGTMDDELPKLIDAIQEILDKHPNEKGLIHCSSYKLRDKIMDAMDREERLISHDSYDRLAVLEAFKQSTSPLVLVSPSMERGISLKDDMARFVISAKAPYLSLGDKKTRLRLNTPKIGQHWYTSMALQTLIQQVGRGVRSKDDYCVVYLIDTQIFRLIKFNKNMLPSEFRECLKWPGR